MEAGSGRSERDGVPSMQLAPKYQHNKSIATSDNISITAQCDSAAADLGHCIFQTYRYNVSDHARSSTIVASVFSLQLTVAHI